MAFDFSSILGRLPQAQNTLPVNTQNNSPMPQTTGAPMPTPPAGVPVPPGVMNAPGLGGNLPPGLMEKLQGLPNYGGMFQNLFGMGGGAPYNPITGMGGNLFSGGGFGINRQPGSNIFGQPKDQAAVDAKKAAYGKTGKLGY